MAQKLDLKIIIEVLNKAKEPLDEISSGLKDVAKDAKKTGSSLAKLSSKLKGISSGMQNVGKGLSKSLTLPLTGLGALSIKAASDLETMNTQFESLLGGSEAAGAMMKDLIKFTASTPFQLDGVVGAAQGLLGFGVASEKIQGNLKTLGDLSAGSGSQLSELVQIFGKVKVKGKASMEEINQLAERRIPIIGTLAKQMGVAESAVLKMASTGKISFDTMNQALDSLTTGSGVYANQMGKQSRTLKGLFSTIKDNANIAFGEIGKQIVKSFNLKKAMESMIVAIQGIVEWFTNLSPVAKNIIVVIGGILAIAGPLILILGKVGIAIVGIANAVTILKKTKFFKWLFRGAKIALKAMWMLGKGIIKIFAKMAIALLTNPIFLIMAAIAAAAFLLIKYWGPISSFFSDLWGKVTSATSEALDIVKESIVSVKDWIAGIFDKIGGFIKGIVDKIKGAAKFVADKVSGLFGDSSVDVTKSVKGTLQGISKSQSDININVSSDQGSTAKVKSINQKKGNSNVLVKNSLGTGF